LTLPSIIITQLEKLMDERSQQKNNPGYYRGLGRKTRSEREQHFKRQSKMHWDDPGAYEPAPGDNKPTKTSKWTKIANKRFPMKKNEGIDFSRIDIELMVAEALVHADAVLLERRMLSEAKKKGGGSATALKNKAKSARAPLGALRAIYNKGLAAWRTGHRPGASQHAWAMGRVNSVLAGGPARKVDAAQWKRIQKFRKGRRKG
jgi:hypothetical protein